MRVRNTCELHTSAFPPCRAWKSYPAFSLVEVALALGIISFAFVAVFGVVPVGLDLSRRAVDASVSGQITQQLIHQAQQTDFSGLPALASESVETPFYFDEQGTVSAEPLNAVYKAVYSVAPSAKLGSKVTTSRLAMVTISVMNTTGRRTSTDPDPLKDPDARKTSFLVSDNGR